jgi:hypothetical protein
MLKFRFMSFALTLLLFLPTIMHSQTTASPVSQIRGAIQQASTAVVPNSKPSMIAHATDLGTVANDRPMNHMLLSLQGTAAQQAAAQQYLLDVQNPASASYHQWLTPAQYGAKFGPSQADRAQIAQWLQGQGFTVNSIAAGGGWIDFSGTAGTVGNVFHTAIHSYTLNGESHIANNSDISIPTALTGVVGGIVRLNNFLKKTPISSMGTVTQRKGQAPVMTMKSLTIPPGQTAAPQLVSSTGSDLVTPGDLQQIYDTATINANGTDGTGTSIAVIGRTNVELADMQAFRQLFGLPANTPQVIVVGLDPGLVAGDEEESALDLEYAGALAPKAQLKFVTAQSTDTADGVDLAAAYAVDNVVAPVLTESYGECEAQLGTAGNQFYASLWQQAAAEGISVVISSGDSGSAGCDPDEYSAAVDGLQVNGLASTPYNTAVGGTMFTPTSLGAPFWSATNSPTFVTAQGYVPEQVWSETCDPTKPVVANGNCADYVLTPRYAFNLNFAGSGGASGCTTPVYTTTNGVSTFTCSGGYPKPSWQSGTGVPADQARDIPDVAFTAAANTAPYVVCQSGSCQFTPDGNGSYDIYDATTVGGTSAATPLFAGMVALLNQKYGPQGLLNYKLYRLANTQAAGSCTSTSETNPATRDSCIFHDVTTGSNAVPCVTGSPNCLSTNVLSGYAAGAGYDEASGLGSVDGSNLVAAWGSTALVGSATTFAATPTTGQHGISINISGKVAASAGSGTPSGQIAIEANGQSYGVFPLTAGAFSGTLTNLPGGAISIHAHYGGDGTYAPSDSSAVSIILTPESSTTTTSILGLTVNGYVPATTVHFGDDLLLRAAVAGASNNGTPTGNVTLMLDGAPLGTYPLNNQGVVELQEGTGTGPGGLYLGVGMHTFTASYAGDSSLNASTSTIASVTVTKGLDSTQITGSSTSPVVNQALVLTCYVLTTDDYLPVNPTGTIQFFDNGVAIGSPQTIFTSGSASSGGSQTSMPWTFTTTGTHLITASYNGDNNFAAASPMYTGYFTAKAATGLTSTVSVSTTTLQPQMGQAVQFYVTVAPTNSSSTVRPTGTITLAGGTSSFTTTSGNTETLAPYGSTILTQAFTAAGPTPLIIQYSGDANFAPSSSVVVPLVVQKGTPAITLTPSATLALPTTQLTLQTLVTASTNTNGVPYATGTVQLYDSVNGAAATPLGIPKVLSVANGSAGYQTITVATLATELPIGTNVITGVYGGNTNYNSVPLPPKTIVITNPDFTVASNGGITLPVGSTGSTTLQLAPELGFNSAVSLACDPTSLPAGVTCAVSPASVAGGSGAPTVTLTSAQPGVVAHLDRLPLGKGMLPLSVLALVGLCLPLKRKNKRTLVLMLVAAFSLSTLALQGCSGTNVHATTLALTSSSTKAAQGTTVTFSATLTTSGGVTPTGSVVFSADGATIGQPAALVSGVAKIDVSSLSIGLHTMQAAYVGDKNTQPSTSNKYIQAITGSTTVRVIATSGRLSHTVSIPVQLQ